jgi:hypothetical protein
MVQQKQKSVVIQSITQILQYLKSEEVNGLITTSRICKCLKLFLQLPKSDLLITGYSNSYHKRP